jgi:CRP/FNR family transcriptional regulator
MLAEGVLRIMGMTLGEQVRLLSMVEIFEVLSREEIEELARRAPDTYLQDGDTFITPQEDGERLYVLKRGRVQIYEVDRNGQHSQL